MINEGNEPQNKPIIKPLGESPVSSVNTDPIDQ